MQACKLNNRNSSPKQKRKGGGDKPHTSTHILHLLTHTLTLLITININSANKLQRRQVRRIQRRNRRIGILLALAQALRLLLDARFRLRLVGGRRRSRFNRPRQAIGRGSTTTAARLLLLLLLVLVHGTSTRTLRRRRRLGRRDSDSARRRSVRDIAISSATAARRRARTRTRRRARPHRATRARRTGVGRRQGDEAGGAVGAGAGRVGRGAAAASGGVAAGRGAGSAPGAGGARCGVRRRMDEVRRKSRRGHGWDDDCDWHLGRRQVLELCRRSAVVPLVHVDVDIDLADALELDLSLDMIAVTEHQLFSLPLPDNQDTVPTIAAPPLLPLLLRRRRHQQAATETEPKALQFLEHALGAKLDARHAHAQSAGAARSVDATVCTLSSCGCNGRLHGRRGAKARTAHDHARVAGSRNAATVASLATTTKRKGQRDGNRQQRDRTTAASRGLLRRDGRRRIATRRWRKSRQWTQGREVGRASTRTAGGRATTKWYEARRRVRHWSGILTVGIAVLCRGSCGDGGPGAGQPQTQSSQALSQTARSLGLRTIIGEEAPHVVDIDVEATLRRSEAGSGIPITRVHRARVFERDGRVRQRRIRRQSAASQIDVRVRVIWV
ncbi:hypothetical protein BKA80DRAFT_274563 [Phyllosticta citrichinensis]